MHRRKKRKNGKNGMIANVRPYAENVGVMAGQAAERVGPMMETAGQRLSGAMSTAAEASEPYRREAALRGRAAWVALCGGDPRQVLRMRQRNRNRRLMLFGGLTVLAVGAAVAYWMIRTAPPSPWHPNAGDDLTSDQRGSEALAPESEGAGRTSGSTGSMTGASTGSTSGSDSARPGSPPQQRTSSNQTSGERSSGKSTR